MRGWRQRMLTEVEVGGPGDVIDVDTEGKSADKDDIQTLNLMRGENGGIFKGDR